MEIFYNPYNEMLCIYWKGLKFYHNDFTVGVIASRAKLRRYGWHRIGIL